jgi:hypothetical protein
MEMTFLYGIGNGSPYPYFLYIKEICTFTGPQAQKEKSEGLLKNTQPKIDFVSRLRFIP